MKIKVDTKASELLAAQQKAEELFRQISLRGLIRPGILESAVNAEIFQLANELYGIKKYWHKRIVRAGPNTLPPYAEIPPDRLIVEDDIVFLDLGPVLILAAPVFWATIRPRTSCGQTRKRLSPKERNIFKLRLTLRRAGYSTTLFKEIKFRSTYIGVPQSSPLLL